MAKKLHNILLVDDDEATNFLHRTILNKMQIVENISIAENGIDALEYLKGNAAPDLIFLDINMPAMNGWEFLEEYHSLNANQKAKAIIVMLTTSLNPLDQKRAENFPEISAYKSKPLSYTVLEEVIKEFFA